MLSPFFFLVRGPGRIQPSNMGTTNSRIKNHPPIPTRSPKSVQKLSGAQLVMSAPLSEGVFDSITSATTLVTEAPPAAASNTGAVPEVTIEAIAPAPNDPLPIRAAFFRLVHPPTQRIGSKQA
jgi:hypothetical protein